MVARKPNRKRVASPCLNPALAQLLGLMRDGGVEAVPDGWLTVTALATQWGISSPTARYHLRRLLAAGLVEVRQYRIPSGNMAVASVQHYRLLA